MSEFPPTRSMVLPMSLFIHGFVLYALWFPSCIMFKPIPANPNPMATSAIQNQAPPPVTPNVKRAHGMK